MLFNSAEYFLFLPIVLGLYWLVRHRVQNALLLVASYVFYGWWDWRFLSLLAVSTVTDYVIARRVHDTERESRRKALLLTSIAVNLGILGFFKYYGFFAESFSDILRALGFKPSLSTLSIVLPIGISFYTFQSISYTFDVYRRRIPPERNLLTFAVYVAFFPQLVAGPIERANRLLPQIQAHRQPPDASRWASALCLILLGLFKKVVIADGLAGLVQSRFADPGAHGALSLLIGVYAFSLQIYGDFSGYSSIARGTARLFGIELIRNFEQPYLSTSVTQFWRTWHISLSTWLHDYLYVPLGGNRRGRWQTYRNIMLTMLLGGLWHGAAWGFVVWGGVHGVLLMVHRAFGAYEPRGRPRSPRPADLWKIVLTFNLVAFSWVFFRADSLSLAGEYLAGFARLGSLASQGDLALGAAVVLVIGFLLLVIAVDWVDRNRDRLRPLERWVPVPVGVAAGIMVAALVVWSGGTPVPFIYFQF
jgi:alginate O-acetyltransferase complex protein AlgI